MAGVDKPVFELVIIGFACDGKEILGTPRRPPFREGSILCAAFKDCEIFI